MKVIDYINLIRDSSPKLQIRIYTEGACFQFHLILKALYPNAIPYYDMNHVISLIDGKFYDITGEITEGLERYELLTYAPETWGRSYIGKLSK